jgi:isopenicillin-N epimerase
VTISHGFRKGYLTEFDWTGTRDSSAFLAVETAIDFHHRLGGAKLRERNVALAAQGTDLLVRRLRTESGGSAAFFGSMGMIRLPIGGEHSPERAVALRKLLRKLGTDAPIFAHESGLWLRISAQAYNELGDYEKLAGLMERAIQQPV